MKWFCFKGHSEKKLAMLIIGTQLKSTGKFKKYTTIYPINAYLRLNL